MPLSPIGEPPSPVLIIGAGPAGLAIAACLRQRGLPLRLVDRRGQPGGAYRDIYGNTTLSSPARYDSLPGLALSAPGEFVAAREYRNYLIDYAAFHQLPIETGTIQSIARDGGRFAVTFEGGQTASYRAVVVASGAVRPSADAQHRRPRPRQTPLAMLRRTSKTPTRTSCTRPPGLARSTFAMPGC